MSESAESADLIADIREQVLYLKEIGVETMDVDLDKLAIRGRDAVPEPTPPERISQQYSRPAAVPDIRIETPPAERPAPGSRLAALPSLTARKKGSFFDKYNPKEPRSAPKPVEIAQPYAKPSLAELPVSSETIEQIRAEIGPDCTRCALGTLGRRQVVNSVGNFNADLMFVGEAPGADEDMQGEPFVGRAGQLLTDIIEKGLGMSRSDVFIGNINRCRPPANRAPEPDESVVCKPFLFREIAVVRPKVIVVLGATAAQNLLETKTPISKLRGQFHDHLGVKVMPTFHPAYLLRDPHKKREVWEDMKMVIEYLKTN